MPTTTPPRALQILRLLVFAEAAAVVSVGGWYLVAELTPSPRPSAQNTGVAVFLVCFSLAVGALLVLSARDIGRGRRRARVPIVTWQVFQFAFAMQLLDVAHRGLDPIGIGGLVLGAAAVLCVVLAVLPSVTTYLNVGAAR